MLGAIGARASGGIVYGAPPAVIPGQVILVQDDEDHQFRLYVSQPGLGWQILEASPDQERFNVKRYGAKGDGVTNDAPAFQAAFDAGVRRVFVPEGTFRIASAVTTGSNVIFEGSGRGKTILKIVDSAGASPISVIQTADGGSGIVIKHLTIDGNRANQSWTPIGSSNYGLVVRSSDTLVFDVECKNVTANGMGVAGSTPATRVEFAHCYSHDNGKKGFHSANPTHVTITGGFYYNNEIDSGIGLHQGMKGATIQGPHCYGNGTYGIHVGDSLGTADSDSRRISITGAHCYLNAVCGILLAGDTAIGDIFVDTTISACQIYQNRYGIQAEVAEGVTIMGCKCNYNTGSGIRLVNPRNIQVIGGECLNNGTNAGDSSRDGIVLANSVSEPNAGIHGRVVLMGVNCSDLQSVPTQQNGIHFDSTNLTDDGILISGCTTFGNVSRQIRDEGSTTSRVHIRDCLGFVTEKNGTAVIPSGSTFVVVTHGAASTPTPTAAEIDIQPTNNLGAATKFWGPTSITGTTFRINVDVDPGVATATFRWAIDRFR